MASRYDLTKSELADVLVGEPAYRVDQLWHGLYQQLTEPNELTTLSQELRRKISSVDVLAPALTTTVESSTDNGDTVKWLYQLVDGSQIETVLMHYPENERSRARSTVCVSSQAGCAMACGFCATGQAGFDRQLTVGEIVEQVVRAQRRATEDGYRLNNIVFMEMGEPLANYNRLWPAIERIHDDLGFGARHITVSTVGVVPGILRLATEQLPVNLAVSLHAANDELRDSLVPLNKRYPLSTLMSACREYVDRKNRRLSFEWALMDGINDRSSDATELSELALSLGAHVNIIPLNPTDSSWHEPAADRVQRFHSELLGLGVNATIRQNRGRDIAAACGQLAAKHVAAPRRRGLGIRPNI